jgi:very-short-patch-repair endonuclease
MPPKPRRWHTSTKIQQHAQQLRREMTPAEKKLWARLRLKQLDGLHFRKQHAVGRYIVDFIYAKGKLVIEIDGDSHVDQIEYDAERTHWLNEQKHYRVIRFTNDNVHKNLNAVLEGILEVVEGSA